MAQEKLKKKAKISDAAVEDPVDFGNDDAFEINAIEFPELQSPETKAMLNSDIFDNIPVRITAELGSTSISLKDVYELSEGAIIELDRHAGEPLDLLVNGQLIAQGEVVAVDNNYGIRIKNIIKNKK